MFAVRSAWPRVRKGDLQTTALGGDWWYSELTPGTSKAKSWSFEEASGQGFFCATTWR